MTDEELCRAAATGDRAAFDELVRRSLTASYALATRLVGHDDAADVVQDAYIRAWRSIKKFRGDSAFRTWMYRIVANTALTHRSRRKRFRESSLEAMGDRADPGSAQPELHIAWDTERIAAAVDRLPDGLRAALVLHDVYEFETEEVARTLDISNGAVRVRLHRARAIVRQHLEEVQRNEGHE
ncbi:MAG: RNA polymerase sigma factor [Acidimicrobiia bacterium]